MLNEVLNKITSDRDKFLMVLPGPKQSIDVKLNIECSFKSSQFPSLMNENIFNTGFSFGDFNNSKIIIEIAEMYPLLKFIEETRVLFDTFQECCENVTLELGSANINCSKIDGTINLKYFLHPKNPEGIQLQTIHEHFIDVLAIQNSEKKNWTWPTKEMLLRLGPRMISYQNAAWASNLLEIIKLKAAEFVAGKRYFEERKNKVVHNPCQKDYCSKKKRRQNHIHINFEIPSFAILADGEMIGEFWREGPGELKYNKNYEAAHHHKGCEKLTENFCIEPINTK